MPSIYRKLYIKFINEEHKKEEDAYKKRNNKNAPTNDELLKQLEDGAKQDKDNKTGLNLNQFIDKMKDKQNKDKKDSFYNKDN
jgi:hypothetical protein